jgi:hypothetical protein
MLSALNYLKSAILYTKKKYGRIGTDIFTSYGSINVIFIQIFHHLAEH